MENWVNYIKSRPLLEEILRCVIPSEEEQLRTKMIANTNHSMCVCLDVDHNYNCWLHMFDLNLNMWVPYRHALPGEIMKAKQRLQDLQERLGEPCKS